MNFSTGDNVNRIEARPVVAAVVLRTDGEEAVEIQYQEGGSGWWPPEALELVDPTP